MDRVEQKIRSSNLELTETSPYLLDIQGKPREPVWRWLTPDRHADIWTNFGKQK
jgi:hypothetical protein